MIRAKKKKKKDLKYHKPSIFAFIGTQFCTNFQLKLLNSSTGGKICSGTAVCYGDEHRMDFSQQDSVNEAY